MWNPKSVRHLLQCDLELAHVAIKPLQWTDHSLLGVAPPCREAKLIQTFLLDPVGSRRSLGLFLGLWYICGLSEVLVATWNATLALDWLMPVLPLSAGGSQRAF